MPLLRITSLPPTAFEFHISAACRKKYQVDDILFGYSGNAILVNISQSQALVHRINQVRAQPPSPLPPLSPAQMLAMGLLDEILHAVAERYRLEKNPKVFEQSVLHLENSLGPESVSHLLLSFTHDFPPMPVHRGQITSHQYLRESCQGYPNIAISIEELMHLWMANANPALTDFSELFDDTALAKSTDYLPAVKEMEGFFRTQPRYGRLRQTLWELLTAPMRYAPNSLADQLRYILENWRDILPPHLLSKIERRILLALDAIKEESQVRGFGPGPSAILDFKKSSAAGDFYQMEERRYSPDLHWMPNVVMIAKNTLVWLWQLSRKYGFEIRRLDQIPESELRELAGCGFNTLWLIGVWERSPASQKIKRICGNSEAAASAYSLYDYVISQDLGGDQAYFALKEKASALGLRLAVDMVPNHTGLYSKWIREHPDWFISLDYPPFPKYTFGGPDLSDDPSIGLYIEDGYWTRSDAAVVFKRVDRRNNSVRYIYHGNDGTHMPWNDTAQLNFLLPQVREAVIQQILRVAGYAPVIRFDAAMTLAKKHYHRLWFPAPGSGGDIPSRSWFGLDQKDFDAAFPEEFWRQVVDRMAAQAPDTLLLAEAFWLMEGYFVRTLGMHRVYNSAFMNMLKKEENSAYRQVLKNVLEYDPQILKRFVNFMNNPDEEPAAVQFGKGDKYFGVCLLLATLPGLPMFGHGQIEGYSEKYGMEYSRAYWEETADSYLWERHRREIFPLLRQRYLFSEVEEFRLYDVVDGQGHVVQDIFAYSNGHQGHYALVVYNNRYRTASGWIRNSVPFRQQADDPRPISQSLSQGLHLSDGPWCLFRDLITGLEYIRSTKEMQRSGLFVELGAYGYHVFSDFRTSEDLPGGELAALHQWLAGRGTPSLERSLWEVKLGQVLEIYTRLLSPLALRGFIELVRAGADSEAEREPFFEAFQRQFSEFVSQSRKVVDLAGREEEVWQQAHIRLRTALDFLGRDAFRRMRQSRIGRRFLAALEAEDLDCSLTGQAGQCLFYSIMVLHSVTQVVDHRPARELFLSRLTESLENFGWDEELAQRLTQLGRIITENPSAILQALGSTASLRKFLEQPEVLLFLGCHWHQDVFWFIKERLQALLYWVFVAAVTERGLASDTGTASYRRDLFQWAATAIRAMELALASGYDFNRYLDLLGQGRDPSAASPINDSNHQDSLRDRKKR